MPDTATFLAVPAELVGDPGRMAALALTPVAGRGPVLLVAGPVAGDIAEIVEIGSTDSAVDSDADAPSATPGPALSGRFTVSTVASGWIETLWTATTRADVPGKPDLVALGNNRAIILLPRRALIGIDLDATDRKLRGHVLQRGRSLPDRLFGVDGGALGVLVRVDGRTVLVGIGPDGARIPGSESAGPQLGSGQRVSALLRDAAGRLVLTADDSVRGFQLWRQGPDGDWAHLVTNGAGRFAQNAGITDAVLWRGQIVLAAGPVDAVRRNLLGMEIRGELILIGPDGDATLICGELRPGLRTPGQMGQKLGQPGLMVPRIAAGTMAALDLGSFTRLWAEAEADGLVTAVERDDGRTTLYRMTPDFRMETLAERDAPLIGPLIPLTGGRIGAVAADVT